MESTRMRAETSMSFALPPGPGRAGASMTPARSAPPPTAAEVMLSEQTMDCHLPPSAPPSRLAAAHPLWSDAGLRFDEKEHVYWWEGAQVPRSVTQLRDAFWLAPGFDADDAIHKNLARWEAAPHKKPELHELIRKRRAEGADDCAVAEAIKALWKAKGDAAASAGTLLHFALQCGLEQWPAPAPGPDPDELAAARTWLAGFCGAHDLVPFRAELAVVCRAPDGAPLVAGQIDLLLKKRDEERYVIVDWKRKAATPKWGGGPLQLLGTEQPGRFDTAVEGGPFDGLVNHDFNKYAAQLNIYAHILERMYDMEIDQLVLVQLGPDVPTPGYHAAVCPRWRERTRALFDALRAQGA